MRNREIQKYIFYVQDIEQEKILDTYCKRVLRRPYLCIGLHLGGYDAFVEAVDYAYDQNKLLLIGDLEALKSKENWLHYLKNSKIQFESPGSPIRKSSLHFLITYAEFYSDILSHKTIVPLKKAKEDIKEKGRYITKQGKVITKLGSPDILSIQKKAAVVHSLKAKAWLGKKGKVIRELRTLGWTFQKIATHMNDLEVPTRMGSTWDKSKVFKIVKRGG
jgi:predicted RNA-binding protein YlqC (UPF0109 family)|tara:strand:+ start:154 stop:810 length:657 start_codon:yes stop_codon:yes gene_type:complete